MDAERPDQGNGILRGILRRVVPWLALIVVATLTWTYLGDYRGAVGDGAKETTGTADATETAGVPGGAYVRVLNDGLNLRAEPMTTSAVLKTLKKDQKLVLVEKGSSWYKVQDDAGTVGWVAAGGKYTELVEP